jgi:hypothetical protein
MVSEHMEMIRQKNVYKFVQINLGHIQKIQQELVFLDVLIIHMDRTILVNVLLIVLFGKHLPIRLQHFASVNALLTLLPKIIQ